MQLQTLIESDGKTVFITSQLRTTPVVRVAFLVLILLLVGAFLWAPLWLSSFQVKNYLILWLLLLGVVGYPVWGRVTALFLTEEVQLDTKTISCQRTYGFIRGRKKTLPYGSGGLATGADVLDAAESQLRVSWFREAPQKQKPYLLYQHFFPMTTGEYEKIKEYMQELFDLEEEGDSFELLFSAN